MGYTNYYEGMRVYCDALTFSQNSLIDADQYRITDIFDEGVIDGLTVGANGTANGLTGSVYITLGTAYDTNGDRIDLASLESPVWYNNAPINNAAGIYYVTVSYEESNDGVYGIDPDGVSHFEHITDSFASHVYKYGTDTIPSSDVILGEVVIGTAGDPVVPTTVNRETMGLKIETTYEGLTVNNFYIQENCTIDGKLTVGGAIDPTSITISPNEGTNALIITNNAGDTNVITANENGQMNVTDGMTIGGNLSVDTSTLYVDAANNRVGIGDSTPSVELDINGDTNIVNGLTIGKTLSVDSGVLYVDPVNNRVGINDTTPSYDLDVNGHGNIINGLTIGQNLTVDTDTFFVNSVSNRVGIGTATPSVTADINGTLQVDSGVLYVDSTNNKVGINDTTPSSTLDITGDGNFTVGLTVNGPVNFDSTLVVDSGITSGGNLSLTGARTISNTSGDLGITGNGGINIKIGATTYQYLTAVGGVRTRFDQNLNMVDNVYMQFGTGFDYFARYDLANTRFSFWTTDGNGGGTDVELIRIEDGTDDLLFCPTSGNVGIRNTAPVTLLDINGGGGSTNGISIGNLGTATKAIDLSNSGLSGSSDYLIYFSGSNKWGADGQIRASGNATFEKDFGVWDNLTVGDSLIVDTNTLYVNAATDRVGINDSTPSFALDVNGGGRFTNGLTVQGQSIVTAEGLSNSKAEVITGGVAASSLIVSGTNVIMSNLPTADPGVAGALWNNGNVLNISAG